MPRTKKAAQPKPELEIHSLAPGLREIERLIDWTAAKFGGFPNGGRVVPVIASSGKKAACYGWFMAPQDIKVGDATVRHTPWATREGQEVAELMINAEALNRDVLDICETVIHETVHLYNWTADIKDCAKSGRHNEKYMESAELFGLAMQDGYEQFDNFKSRGHAFTELSPKLRAELEGDFVPDVAAFNLFKMATPTKPKSEPKTVKFMCVTADCEMDMAARAVKDWKGNCGVCGKGLEIEEKA